MTEQLTVLKGKRSQIKAKLTRFRTFLDSYNIQDGLTQIQMRLSKVEECYSEFETVQSDIEIVMKQDVQEQERVEFEDAYFSIVARAQQLIQQSTTPSSQSNTSQMHVTEVKLPAIELPSFHGNYEEWLPFKDTFLALIHNNESLTDIQRFHYLRSSLKSSASELIHSLQLTAANYPIAWQMLHERYENKRIIVQSHVRALFGLPKVDRESASSLRRLLDDTVKHIRSLKALGLPTEHWDALLVHLMYTKLDPATQRQWESSAQSDRLPTILDITGFLQQRCQVLEAVEMNRKAIPKEETRIPWSKTTPRTNPNGCFTAQVGKCNMCGTSHRLYQCTKFLQVGVEDRRSMVRKWQLCFNCLGRGHVSKECKSSHCKRCSSKHNTLLHLADVVHEGDRSDKQPTLQEPQQGSSFTGHAINRHESQVLLATALINVVNHRGVFVTCRAMLDSGSQSNYMTAALCSKLGLRKQRVSVPVVGINGTATLVNHSIRATFKSRHTDYNNSVDFLLVPKITDHMPSSPVDPSKLSIPSNITLADPFFYDPGNIDILLGADVFWELLGRGQLKPETERIIFQETQLGWIITGRVENHQHTSNTSCYLSVASDINAQLQRFWQLEECRGERVFTGEDKLCEDHFKENVRRQTSGEYTVKMPLKGDSQLLGNSRKCAEERLFRLERRFAREPELHAQYSLFMQEYADLGHMEHVPEADEEQVSTRYYLPHHPVVKDSSTTTKLRVVFDASAKTDSGVCLNDLLMVGPTVQDDLFSIIVRFRTHRYALTADIEKMYRQIKMDSSDSHLQMILWRESTDQPAKAYRLTTVTYGTACAPYLATRTLHQLADDESKEFPSAATVLKRDFYVDDLLTGADTIDEARMLQSQLVALLKRGGFMLRKWCTNHDAILSGIPESMKTQRTTLKFDEGATVKTLGLLWDPDSDHFKYDVQAVEHKKKETTCTKRSVLAEISRVFDPLGLIGPVILTCKIFLQELWLQQIDWDDPLPLDTQEKWISHKQSLAQVKGLAVPRRIVTGARHSSIQLHGFCDASINAYGACVYLRCIDEGRNISVRLICSKSRVAPIKTQSIPRLELCGAVLLSELMHKVRAALTLNVDQTFYWSDSRIVLAWLAAPSTNWSVFVANRVSKIQESTIIDNWRHVSTGNNPADLVSRGVSALQLMDSELWWEGAPWLREEEDSWPKPVQAETNEEARGSSSRLTTLALQDRDTTMITRFSTLTRLRRVLAYCCRFAMNSRIPANERKTGPLSTEELHSSLNVILRMEQDIRFSEEIRRLRSGTQVSKGSELKSLNPFLDPDGLLKVGGRLQHANIADGQKHPIIIPSKGHLTMLIAQDYHIRNLHVGPSALLNAIREEYWPLRGKQLARRTVHDCVRCSRLRSVPTSQLMGDLPASRVTPSRPFLHTGVDYCGPVFVRHGGRKTRASTKTYVALFICFSTKAVHLEVVSDLTTSAFLGALHRFVARRGKCAHLYSDNARNFVGARRELDALNNLFQSEEKRDHLVTTLATEGIQWHFIPPRVPHMGGLWEAGIKAFKYHFRRVVGNTILSLEELTTLTAQIEACLNSRPLTLNPSDPNDPAPLTPAHFLIGSSLTAIPEPNLQLVPENRLSRWQHLQQMLQHFWQRWSKEYLNSLQQRSKWRLRATNIREGAVVLIKEDNSPPLSWRMGKIVALHPGSDGVTRVVTVKVANGQIKRHVNRLCPLPV